MKNLKIVFFAVTCIIGCAIPPITYAITHSMDAAAISMIPALGLAVLAGKQFADLAIGTVADGVKEGLQAGLDKFFNGPAFSQMMDKSFASACSSLANEADIVGNHNLAAGYRILGNIKKEWEIGCVTMDEFGNVMEVSGEDDHKLLVANAKTCLPHFTGEAGVFTLQDNQLKFEYKWFQDHKGHWVVARLIFSETPAFA